MSQFNNRQKAEVLDDVKRMGNLSKVAEKYGITRMTIYNWQRQEDEIRGALAQDSALRTIRESFAVEPQVLEGIESYAELLAQKGALEKRKQLLSAHVEFILWKVVKLLEGHPDLDGIHPKDLSKIMTDLHAVRKELSNEPTVIVEYRNEWMGRVLSVLQDFMGEEDLREFAKKMQAVEAEYEIL